MTSLPGQIMTAIDFAADLLRGSQRAVVLTGAGISVPSGIPDFRSAGTGLWSRDEPLEAASLMTFRTHPEKFFNWFRPLASQIFNAAPNPAHHALTRLEQAGRVSAVITQNIDGLHQKAGSQRVIETHGSLRTLSCTRCYHRTESKPFIKEYVEAGCMPLCPECSGVLKPDVILFGEQLPHQAWLEAQRAACDCDLMVVAGSSLEVLPVAGLPMQALDRGAHLIIINNSPTYLDVRADLTFRDDVADIIPALAGQALHG
jgi:NAD-dependent deacetylase